MKKLLCLLSLIICCSAAMAQQSIRYSPFRIWGQVAIGKNSDANPAASAWLEIGPDSTTKGLIPPRVLNTGVVTSPRPGMVVYSYQDTALMTYTGTYWKSGGSGGSGGGGIVYSSGYGIAIVGTVIKADTSAGKLATQGFVTRALASYVATISWTNVTGKPSSFPPSAHTHLLSDLLQSGATTGQVATWNGSGWVPATPSGAGVVTWGSITGTLTDQSDLGTALSGKASTSHTHTFASLTSKPTTISGYGITDAFTQTAADALYAALGHTHTFSSLTSKPTTITGYGITDAFTQSAADALYSPLGHTHTFSSLTSKPTTLAGYGITDAAAASHTHAESDVTNLVTDLAAKATVLANSSAKTTSYTLTSADAGKIIWFNSASGVNCTIPSGLPAGFNCTVIQQGAGQVTFVASSTTLHQADSYTKTAKQYAWVSIASEPGTSNTYTLGGYMQ